MGFAKFMASGAGRLLRMIAGLVLIVCGLLATHGTLEVVLGLLGIVAFAAGLFNFCLIAPFLGVPFLGKNLK